MRLELVPIYDLRQSFYKKAYYEYTEDGGVILYSYDLLVCVIDSNNNILLNQKLKEDDKLFTQTTTRYIKEFIKQFYYKFNMPMTKKDLLKLKFDNI